MVGKIRVMVLTGEGINCDYETADAFIRAGGTADRVHVNDLIAGAKKLEDYHILAVPGGFSYGDDLGAGKAFASKILHAASGGTSLFDELTGFISDGKLVIGICNGFQILVKMGLLPAIKGYGEQEVSVFKNDSGKFEDRWVRLTTNRKSNCVFTRGIDRAEYVCRHGEGKFIPRDETVARELWKSNQAVFQYADAGFKPTMDYPSNPNGSVGSIAGICDRTGRVFGLMPHPEAYLDFTNHPHWTRRKKEMPADCRGDGLKIFENAVNYVQEKL
ncbi:MAG: phosphoribosylformylglycinamidine synthase subunit PurQ [archaeon]